MMISSPASVAAPKPAPAATTLPTLPATPAAPAPKASDAAKAAPAPAAPSREEAIAKTMSMSAQDAVASVVENFSALNKLTIGGGTPEGAEQAKVASMLLTHSSNMLQLAHLKASEQIRSLADELDMRMMAASTELAFLGGQVALAGGSKQAVQLSQVAAEPMKAAVQTMSDVVAAITPKDAPSGAPAAPGPASTTTSGAPARSPTDAPAAPATPTTAAPAPAAPGGLQHLTPGPGTGRGPNPA